MAGQDKLQRVRQQLLEFRESFADTLNCPLGIRENAVFEQLLQEAKPPMSVIISITCYQNISSVLTSSALPVADVPLAPDLELGARRAMQIAKCLRESKSRAQALRRHPDQTRVHSCKRTSVQACIDEALVAKRSRIQHASITEHAGTIDSSVDVSTNDTTRSAADCFLMQGTDPMADLGAETACNDVFGAMLLPADCLSTISMMLHALPHSPHEHGLILEGATVEEDFKSWTLSGQRAASRLDRFVHYMLPMQRAMVNIAQANYWSLLGAVLEMVRYDYALNCMREDSALFEDIVQYNGTHYELWSDASGKKATHLRRFICIKLYGTAAPLALREWSKQADIRRRTAQRCRIMIQEFQSYLILCLLPPRCGYKLRAIGNDAHFRSVCQETKAHLPHLAVIVRALQAIVIEDDWTDANALGLSDLDWHFGTGVKELLRSIEASAGIQPVLPTDLPGERAGAVKVEHI